MSDPLAEYEALRDRLRKLITRTYIDDEAADAIDALLARVRELEAALREAQRGG